jgi:hypothetical protein
VEYLDVGEDEGVATWDSGIESENTLLSLSTRVDNFVLWAHNEEIDQLVGGG